MITNASNHLLAWAGKNSSKSYFEAKALIIVVDKYKRQYKRIPNCTRYNNESDMNLKCPQIGNRSNVPT